MLGVSVAAFSLWLLGKQTQQVTHGSFLISRRDFWGPATVLFKAHPLTGAGPDLYTWFYPGQFSIPPGWLPPHAHSLLFQIISGSGLLGIAALLGLGLAGGVALRRRWSSKPDRLMTAALLSSLAGVLIHHLFDYLFGTPIFAFLFVVVSALAFAPEQTLGISSRSISPRSFILPLALTIGITAFSLRGAALNDQGLQLARRGDWAGAALAFQHAAETDPGLTLYWEEAAQALTRAGDVPAAIPLWQRAARDDPYWALWPGTLAVLTHDPAAMQSALKIASRSDLLALNAGVLFESGGDLAAAREAYHRALTLNPTSARGLFWQQTHFRAALLAEWQATQPVNDSPLAQGWEALEAGDADRARALFEQARAADPLSNEPYVGLARVEWAVGNEAQAERTLRAGQTLQVAVVSQKIAGLLLEGDWATAHGDRATALTAYTVVFSAVNDYTILGPGTYGYPARSWYVFHRAALPSDLIPQFARADITPELDSRFAQLAQWYAEDGELGTACFIVKRVYAEAPISQSGRLKEKLCR